MFKMSFENFGNLEMVLAYLHTEEQNYEENPDEHHIWLNIKPLKEPLHDSVNTDAVEPQQDDLGAFPVLHDGG